MHNAYLYGVCYMPYTCFQSVDSDHCSWMMMVLVHLTLLTETWLRMEPGRGRHDFTEMVYSGVEAH